MAAAAAVALLAGMFTGLQIRAAQAQDRRDEIAAEEAAEQARLAEERTETARSLARDRLETLDRANRVAAWTIASSQAEVAVANGEAALAGSEGKVADDAVRYALATSLDALRALLAADPDDPSTEEATALAEATTAVVDATAAVSAAQAAWQAEQDAAAAAAAARPRDNRSGAGADCGGTGSYEPSNGGTVLHTSVPTEEGDGTNGNMPRSAMTALGWCTDAVGNQQWLRTDAAEALVRLNDAFRAQFGENIAIDLSYRSYADQVRARELFGRLAAQPGTSNHGWGTAFDTWEWAAYDFGSDRYNWLVTNGPAYGWHSPASSDPGNPEYWHYEYRG